MTFFSHFFIALIYFVGKVIGGKWCGVLGALFVSISTATIDNSFMTWVSLAAMRDMGLFAIFFFLKYWQQKKARYIFSLGLTISLATTIHFQTFLLSPLIFIALLISKLKIKHFLALGIGILIPLLPFWYFDLRFNFFEIRRIIDYATIGQYRIYVPNRWLTYVGVFWPTTWAWIIGGKTWMDIYLWDWLHWSVC